MLEMLEEFFATSFGAIILKIINVLLVFVICGVFIKLSKRLTKKAVLKSRETGNLRVGTVLTLVQSTLKYVIYFIGFAIIMAQFNVNLAPIIASAGVVGVAVAFGAQSLVKDVIGGLFIMLEDSYAVGDYIKAGGVSGFVTEVGLRTTKLRDWTNELHIVPNGNISVISNYSKDDLTCYIDIPVAYAPDSEIVLSVMREALDKLNKDYAGYNPRAKVLGLNNFENNRIIVKAVFYASVNDQLFMERAVRLACKNAFDKAGISMPACYNTIMEQKVAAND